MKLQRIAGVDEVGRGPVAGPVVIAAVCFENSKTIEDYLDSKTLSEKRREALSTQIIANAAQWVLVALGPATIDQMNILQATRFAMKIAIDRMNADEALVDGNMKIETSLPYRSIVKGDSLHREIGAASIIAKVWRDRLMKEYDVIFPGYQFGKHKGYPSKVHQKALEELGPSPVHRFSYSTVSKLGISVPQAPLSEIGDQLTLSSERDSYEFLPKPGEIVEYERSALVGNLG